MWRTDVQSVYKLVFLHSFDTGLRILSKDMEDITRSTQKNSEVKGGG